MMQQKNCFDSLRLVAATAVLVGHGYELPFPAQPHGMHGDPLQRFTGVDTLAALGVIMFFALSGYLVTQSLMRSRTIWQFGIKRCLRIFPALWVCVLISLFVWGPLLTSLDYASYILDPQASAYFGNAFLSLHGGLPGVFAENPRPYAFNGSLWTLPIEFRLYVLLALFVIFGHWGVRPGLIVLGVALAGLMYWHFVRGPVGRTAYFHVASLFVLKLATVFWLGSVIAAWRLERWLSWLPGLFLTAGVCMASARWPFLQYYLWFPFALTIGYTTLALGLRLPEFLAPITRRGDFSYGLYLWAFPVQQTVIFWLHPVEIWTVIGWSALGAGVLAIASWYAVERPALRLKSGV